MRDTETSEEWWHALLTGTNPAMPLRQVRHIFALIPGHVRCKFCNAPFDGRWTSLLRLLGRGQSRLTTQFCQQCQAIATKHIGGAEIELTLLFAEVRGSTKLGELGIYIPYFVGPHHEHVAINAAQDLLHATGNDERGEPWIQVAEQVSLALVDVAEHMQIADSFQRDWKDADWQGLSSRFKAVGMLIQVVNHGVEHRTNITTILAQQGIQPPSLDGWEYMRLNPDRMGA